VTLIAGGIAAGTGNFGSQLSGAANASKKSNASNASKKPNTNSSSKKPSDPRVGSTYNHNFGYKPYANDYNIRYKFGFGYFARSVMGGAFSGAITSSGFYGLGKSFGAISRSTMKPSLKMNLQFFGNKGSGNIVDNIIKETLSSKAT
jgi:hypothetical protein